VLKTSIQNFALIEALRASDVVALDKLLDDLTKQNEATSSGTDAASGIQRSGALHLACSFATRDIVKHILKRVEIRQCINVQNEKGNTPMHIAATSSRRDIIDLLLEIEDVNDTIRNVDGKTPLDLADTEVASLIKGNC
jgi:ankyrin repeat protein